MEKTKRGRTRMALERAIYTGAYSVKNFQTKLDVHGNNISNISTIGFKRSTAKTIESFQEQLQNAVETNGALSQINSSELGYGQSQILIDIDARNGILQETGRPLDLAIQGDGYFMVEVNEDRLYTRDGNFDLDRDNNVTMPHNGAYVLGWIGTLNPDGTTTVDPGRTPERLQLDSLSFLPAKTSSFIDYSSNLNTESTGRNMTLKRDRERLEDANRNNVDIESRWNRTSDNSWTLTKKLNGEELFAVDATIDVLGNITALSTRPLQEGLEITSDPETGAPLRIETTYTSPTEDEPDFRMPMTFEFDNASILSETGSQWKITARLADFEDPGYQQATAIDFTSNYDIGTLHDTMIQVVDSAGNTHDLSTRFEKIASTDTEFEYRLGLPNDNPYIQAYFTANGIDPQTSSTTALERANDAVFGQSRHGRLAFTDKGLLDPSRSTIPNLNGTLVQEGETPVSLNLSLNMDLITGFGSPFSTSARNQDGYVAGELIRSTVSSNGDGRIVGNFTNGEERVLGQIGIGIFQNASGLLKAGNNMFRAGDNAGVDLLTFNIPSEGRRGLIKPGFLELSNVNVLEEFTQLIITQRSLQANSKAITVADQLLQTGINTKR